MPDIYIINFCLIIFACLRFIVVLFQVKHGCKVVLPCLLVGVAVLEGPLYAVGGHDGWSYLNTVERWDPQARQWNFVATMSTPRSTVGVAVLSGK